MPKTPSIGKESFTPNLTVHLTGVILKTATSVGDCAHVIDANKVEERKQKTDRIIGTNAKSSSSGRPLSRVTGRLGPVNAMPWKVLD